jgi:hypothetical protein
MKVKSFGADETPSHLIILGTFDGKDCGVAVIQSHKDPCKVRELATHSASAEMAVEPLAQMVQAVADKFGPNEKLHPVFHAIVERIRHAADLLKEADALNNYDRKIEMGFYPKK